MEKLIELPNNVKAEIELLGWAMNNENDLVKVVGGLRAEDFYSTKNKEIFKAMCSLFAVGTKVNQITIIETMGKKIASEVGLSYIASVTSEAVMVDCESIMSIIREKSRLRAIIKSCRRAIEESFAQERKSGEIAYDLQNSLVEKKEKDTISNESDVMDKTLDLIQERCKNNGKLPGMKTGYRNLDMHMKGFQGGKFMVIGGEPGMGKSLVSLNLAEGVSNFGKKVLYFSIEMDESECGIRRMAAKTMIPMEKIEFGKLDDNDFKRIAEYANDRAKKDNFFMDCTEYQDVNSILTKIKMMHMTKGVDVVFIDHIGLVDLGETSDAFGSSKKLGRFTWALKSLARELNICIVALSQLNTSIIKTRANKRPLASDLYGSKEMRENADIIILCYREYVYDNEANQDELELIFDKFRGGRMGVVPMKCMLGYHKMIDYGNI